MKFNEIQQFVKSFPGVGEKQATRITYFLMRQKRSTLVSFSQKLIEIKDSVSICPESNHLFSTEQGKQNNGLSPFLSDAKRKKEIVLVIEKQSDIDQFEALNFEGIYYIIDTLFSLKNQERDIDKKRHFENTLELWHKKSPLAEIIFACSLTHEAEFTEYSLAAAIKKFCEQNTIRVSHLARGLSSGSEISYMDSDTLSNALKFRV